MKRALIFGINGMDGSHLADLLLEKGYEVYGTVRHSSADGHLRRVQHCLDRIHLLRADLADSASVRAAVNASHPDEVYNEADQDEVGWSYSLPEYAHEVTAGGPLRILETLRTTRYDAKFFQPLSSTMFGNPVTTWQDEATPLAPRSPYAVAKCAAKYWCEYYRRVHGMFVACGIMYTHSSERQHGDYLIHKIARAAARGDKEIALGNLNQFVDIGDAESFMEAAHLMMQHRSPATLVVGTGSNHKIGSLVRGAYATAGVEDWKVTHGEHYVDDPPSLVADPAIIKDLVGWRPKHDAYTLALKLTKHYMERS